MGNQERFKTYGNVFDNFTMRNLFKLSSQGFFEELASPISIGKEANIFSAKKKDGSLVIVKIYRLENCNFNAMWSYLQTDPRYESTKPTRRNIIFAWVQREFRNLLKSREAQVRVPTPLQFLANIIVEEYIGTDNIPAPQLNKAVIENPEQLAKDVLSQMKTLFNEGKIIHGDLSPFNILYHNEKPFFIDMSQSTSIKDPNAQEYLERDIKNMVTFFAKLGVDCAEEFQKSFKLEKS